ncbi:hypothetical protein cyc_02225 [Cyclospora cayetanensis]|uniref:Uncharacterized protein n=1 Tax=Cyclospora cayetanensis TaxID=88456 RepID=A0A1D3D8X3_9EIME|nr:hypothetical protein cyc_02225 [Cyclospora cayetanensis]
MRLYIGLYMRPSEFLARELSFMPQQPNGLPFKVAMLDTVDITIHAGRPLLELQREGGKAQVGLSLLRSSVHRGSSIIEALHQWYRDAQSYEYKDYQADTAFLLSRHWRVQQSPKPPCGISRLKMGEDDSARSNKRVELLLSANGAGGKEVYEYTPDPGSVVSHASSSPDGIDKGDAHRSLRGAKEIDDTEVRPSTAYEFFRGKTYKSTAFQNGFSTRRAWRGSSSGVMEVRGQRTVLSAYKGDKVSDIGSMSSTVSEFREASSFETPIARLRRLQSEVEEMLDFVSSFLVEERVHLPKGVGTEGAEPEKAAPSDEVSAEQGESSKSTGLLQVQYQARRLSQGAKEALLFGNDPLSLIEELKRLRMQLRDPACRLTADAALQGRRLTALTSLFVESFRNAHVSSVLSDKKTEALVSHIEPVTGMRSGAALLAQHLSTASTQLQQVLANEAEALSLPSKSSNSAATSAVAVRVGDAQPAASGGVTAGDGGAELASTAYEVYCVPSLSPMIEQSRITFLERRLALVENKMGLHKMSLLPHADLFEAVNEMQQRIKLLDAQKIESLQKRVQGLLLELHALQQRRHELDMAAEGVSTPAYGASVGSGGEYGRGRNAGAPAAASDWQRVEELYDICERWKAPAAVLPSVLQRLKLLKGIHQEAGGVSVRLSVLEKQQEELQAWVKRADEAVTQLQKTVLESIEWAQRTVSQMQQRLVAVDASATTDT